MNESQINLADVDSTGDVETKLHALANGDDEHLATTRLPPLPRPPHPVRAAAHGGVAAPRPTPSSGVVLPPLTPPPIPGATATHSVGSSASVTTDAPAVSHSTELRPPPVPRPSWWRMLLTPAAPGAASRSSSRSVAAADRQPEERWIALIVASLALVLVLVAMVIGLREAPSETEPPVVIAALVLARSFVALGVFAVGLTLLRMAERFFTRSSS